MLEATVVLCALSHSRSLSLHARVCACVGSWERGRDLSEDIRQGRGGILWAAQQLCAVRPAKRQCDSVVKGQQTKSERERAETVCEWVTARWSGRAATAAGACLPAVDTAEIVCVFSAMSLPARYFVAAAAANPVKCAAFCVFVAYDVVVVIAASCERNPKRDAVAIVVVVFVVIQSAVIGIFARTLSHFHSQAHTYYHSSLHVLIRFSTIFLCASFSSASAVCVATFYCLLYTPPLFTSLLCMLFPNTHTHEYTHRRSIEAETRALLLRLSLCVISLSWAPLLCIMLCLMFSAHTHTRTPVYAVKRARGRCSRWQRCRT